MSVKATERVPARERILAAADELFYEEGVRSVGIDRVIERAGVAKASLYNTYGSKEELIRAYLDGRQVARRTRIERHVAAATEPRARVLAVFDALAEALAQPGYRGCAFQNASSEAYPGAGIQEVIESSRGWLRSLLTELAREAGAAEPAQLADQLALLYDGASIGARIDRGTTPALTARGIAETLIDAAIAH
jgi:AcrR family transcriptional regulator